MLRGPGTFPLLTSDFPVPETQQAPNFLLSVDFAEYWMNHRSLYILSLPLEKFCNVKDGYKFTQPSTPAILHHHLMEGIY